MGAASHHKPLVLSVEGLVALLDFLDKPAAVVNAQGRILGANQNFGEFLSRRGLATVDHLGAVLAPDSCEWVTSGAADVDSPRARSVRPLAFQDGQFLAVRTEVFSAGSALVTLLVVTPPEGEASGVAARASASLRHDIAGPLTAILGAAELLLLRGEVLAPEVRRGLTSILESCGRISEILQRSRRPDRPDAGEPA